MAAAKQGFSAQLSQAGEDAKRAVLQRTSLTSSPWFSNLNTTCTIKSAPPRTPQVLNLLSTKSGWLYKRNEQHVWQPRWCCVVPHTFLYYFDSAPPGFLDTSKPPLSHPSAKQQQAWNSAVRNGYPHHRGSNPAPRSSLYHVFPDKHTTDGPASSPPPNSSNNSEATLQVQPTGIIDLECYSRVHRSSKNELVLELAGDEAANPDLRTFYFTVPSSAEGEEWTQALLSQRHAALVDEREAYRQVCDGFAQQLQQLHQDLDSSQLKQSELEDELYRVRSQMEELRRSCWRLLQESLERPTLQTPVENAKRAYKADLQVVQSQDMGLMAAVQLLCDYTRVLEDTTAELHTTNTTLKGQLQHSSSHDREQVASLQRQLQQQQEQHAQEKASLQQSLQILQQKHAQTCKELDDVTQNWESTKLEMNLFQTATRNKLQQVQSHKKILKKEVIELRAKLDEAGSQITSLHHSARSSLQEERRKSELLERYVEKMESQVQVQQNMMEMMSQGGAASVHGGASYYAGAASISSQPVPRPNDFNSSSYFEEKPPPAAKTTITKALDTTKTTTLDDDNKSHMSELTEDRTQKQFLEFSRASPRPVPQGPPSFIIGVHEQQPLDTIAASGPRRPLIRAVSDSIVKPPKQQAQQEETVKPNPSRLPSEPRQTSAKEISPQTKRLSVAQRARMEADARNATPVRVRMASPPSQPSGNRFFANLGKRLEEAIDNSVLGYGSSEDEDDDESRSSEGSDRSDGDDSPPPGRVTPPTRATESETSTPKADPRNERRRPEPRMRGQEQPIRKENKAESVVSTSSSMTLQERQRLQRAKQLAFLKDQGLIQHDDEVRGGAGAASPSNGGDTASVTSTSISYAVSSISFPGTRRRSTS